MTVLANELTVLYRGQLSSCNYACGYCPFAKRRDPASVLAQDEADLARFVDWVGAQPRPMSVFFTPWGEALTRSWYRQAMVKLSHMSNVRRVAAQTNLSCGTDWIDEVDREAFALWATFHPSEVRRERFVGQVTRLHEAGVRLSAGMVGFADHLAQARRLRQELPGQIYLWVNAPDDQKGAMSRAAIEAWTQIDPLFEHNTVAYESKNQPCRSGHSVISVSGDGSARPCHFVDQFIGNIYAADFADRLGPRRCPQQTCDCHIGYVHMPGQNLYEIFGTGVLERIPATELWR